MSGYSTLGLMCGRHDQAGRATRWERRRPLEPGFARHKEALESLSLHGTVTEDFSSIKPGTYDKDAVLFTGKVMVMAPWFMIEPIISESGIRVSAAGDDARTGHLISSPDEMYGGVTVAIPGRGATRVSLLISERRPSINVSSVAFGADESRYGGISHLHDYHADGKVVRLEAHACPGDVIRLVTAVFGGFELGNLEFDMA